jgi:hypothetical protein
MQDWSVYMPFVLSFGVALWALGFTRQVRRESDKKVLDLKSRLEGFNDSLLDICERLSGLKMDISSVKLELTVLDSGVVKKADATYKTVMGVLAEASSQGGEGLFLVRHLPEGTYLWKVPKKEVVELSPKEIKQS